MDTKILEINADISGRRRIKIALHEIYADATTWNENGISWLEQYTRDNADTVKGMPLCAEFVDKDKDIPYGHGMTGIKGDIPVFEESEQVGAFENWTIEDIEIDGEKHKCLCGIGYINENRYPKFCDWIERQFYGGNRVFGSVETTGTKENHGEIIYDGGWKEQGRIPMIYDYTGFCIITMRPADDKAVLLEYEKGQSMNKEEKDNFDDVFLDLMGERNTATDSSEFDSIFDDSKPKKPIKTEFDDILDF